MNSHGQSHLFRTAQHANVERPARLLAISVIEAAKADLVNRGASPTDKVSAAGFLAGCEPYRELLEFWCAVAGLDHEAVIAAAWRAHHAELAHWTKNLRRSA